MQSFKFTKLSPKYPLQNEKSHTAVVSKEISFNNGKPTSPRTNEEVIAFHGYRHKLLRKPRIIDTQTRLIGEGGVNEYYNIKKYPFCSLFKFNQALQANILPKGISPTHPININIQNININNIHYYNRRTGIKKTKDTTSNKEQVSYFPILTAPNIDDSNKKIKQSKKVFKKIRLVDLDKLKTIKKNEEKEVMSAQHKKIILSNKKIDVVEDNNDSFLDELADILHNVEEKLAENKIEFDKIEVQSPLETEANLHMNINIEDINRVNSQRPQTSYGGLSARKKSMQNSLRQKSSKQTTERLLINLPNSQIIKILKE